MCLMVRRRPGSAGSESSSVSDCYYGRVCVCVCVWHFVVASRAAVYLRLTRTRVFVSACVGVCVCWSSSARLWFRLNSI